MKPDAATPTAPLEPAVRERLAAIDVGSNSIRLLVADHEPGSGITIVDEIRSQPRLARGLASTGRLDDDAVEAALISLARMRDVCERRGVQRISAVATAAVREASNGRAFLRRARDEIGIPLRVVNARAEARLSWLSVAHHFRLEGERTVVADIGGGSLELVGAIRGIVEVSESLPLGAVRLSESFGTSDKTTARKLERLRGAIRRCVRPVLKGKAWHHARLIGSGGTFTSLARLALVRRADPVPDTVHGLSVSAAEVEHLLEWLAGRTVEQRRALPGLSPERADIIVAGIAVIAELISVLEAREVTVSGFGLREGLLLSMIGERSRTPHDRLRLIREFAERCQTDRRHVEQVRFLALRLFAQLGAELGLTEEDVPILEAAALLHDVGQLVSYRRHQKHSYQLIMHAERLPFEPRERELVALASLYHRKAAPKKSDEVLAGLDRKDWKRLKRIVALLRVADGLDRGHQAILDEVRCTMDDDHLLLEVSPRFANADVSLEIWGGTKKADVLRKVSGRTVEIRAFTTPADN